MLDIFKYCYQCGKSLSYKNIDNNNIPYCDKCESRKEKLNKIFPYG